MYIGFFHSYHSFDFLGKSIFWILFLLSLISWVLMIYKIKSIKIAKKRAFLFEKIFLEKQKKFFSIKSFEINPFFSIYENIKSKVLKILNKNSFFTEKDSCFLSKADIDFLKEEINVSVLDQCKFLEKNIFILSIIITLAPFLGLLGTVWGILITFSNLQKSVDINQQVLSGISMALTTTIMGLLVAIPAIVAYGYLKNVVKEFFSDMQNFSNKLIFALELQYRKVDKR